MIAAILIVCGCGQAQAQIMKTADLEKYAKEKYGEKWLDAAANIAKTLVLDKNNNLTYQQVIEAPGKTKSQLYVMMNYWVTATFKDKQSITLNDKETGAIIINATMENIATHTGGLNQYSVSITPIIKIDIKDGKVRVTYTVQSYDVLRDISGGVLGAILDSNSGTFDDQKRKKQNTTNRDLYDETWELTSCYPFTEKDKHVAKRTSAKALVMTHAYSNAVFDKVEEAVKNGIVGNEDEDW
ncbi:MAG: DUF4468 domain-containing protein [Prevotella sp.]|nr:DUF4468 domain-containing protein [Prevotella sp.]